MRLRIKKIFFMLVFCFYVFVFIRYFFIRADWSFVLACCGDPNRHHLLANLIPFKNIVNYTVNFDRYNAVTVFRNLLLPFLAFIPFGFLVNDFKSLRARDCFTCFSTILFVFILRLLMLRGLFDIDKALLSFFGFLAGAKINQILADSVVGFSYLAGCLKGRNALMLLRKDADGRNFYAAGYRVVTVDFDNNIKRE